MDVIGELDIPESTKKGNNIGGRLLRAIIHKVTLRGARNIVWIMGGIILWVINSSLAAVINITIILYGPHIASNTRTTFLALEARGNWRFFRIVAESTIFTGWGGIGIGARSRPEGVDIEIFLQVGGVLLKYGTNTHAFVFNGGSTDEVEELHRSFSLMSSPS